MRSELELDERLRGGGVSEDRKNVLDGRLGRAESNQAALSGKVELDGALIPVTVSIASANSLHVVFVFGTRPDDGTIFPRLVLHAGKEDLTLTRCRLDTTSARNQVEGQLVFLDDVYDCRALVSERKLVSTRHYFQNLPLVVSQKERIDPDFREFCVNLLYDLSAYKKFFDEQDRLLQNEPVSVQRAAFDAIRRGEGRAFYKFLDQKIGELGDLVAAFDKEGYERHGFYLRRLMWEFLSQAEFLRRTNLKPRGYAGDAEMMLMAYRNEYVGRTLFEQLLHKHPLESPAAEAVRYRPSLIAKTIHEQKARHSGDRKFRFLSVACGPASELSRIYRSKEDVEQMECVLLDQDRYALDFAEASVHEVERNFGAHLSVSYLSESVRTMLRRPQFSARLGKFDAIYSMGLFDYLTPFVAQAVLSRMYDMLAPGGRIVVGNFHVDNPTRHYMAYFMDWVLYHRTEPELLDLAGELSGAKSSLAFDPSGCQMFLTVEKQG